MRGRIKFDAENCCCDITTYTGKNWQKRPTPHRVFCRHSYELGGTAFSLSVVWAQVMPFVALWVYERRESGEIDDIEEEMWNMEDSANVIMTNRTLLPDDRVKFEMRNVSTLLTCSFALWVLTNAAFFYTINLNFLDTFFGMQTASQYTIGIFLKSEDDSTKFRTVFTKRLSYTKPIWGEVKTWVEQNVDRWREENEEWFQADKIPDEFLPARVQLAEGGASRRRFSEEIFKEVTELVGGEKLKREED